MKLSFYAAGKALVPERHSDGGAMQPSIGAVPRYVGRAFDSKLRGFPAMQEAYSVDSEESPGEAKYLRRECRRGALFAADTETARACGTEYAACDFNDGTWSKRVSAASAKAPMAAGKGDS